MTRRRAITLALECIQREIKKLAADANFHDVYHADSPYAIKASARRRELREAVQALREPTQTRML